VYYTQRGRVVYVQLLGGDKRKQDRDIKRVREMMQPDTEVVPEVGVEPTRF
jgi:putative component of toxin-antitoxin plasmid stabilization module